MSRKRIDRQERALEVIDINTKGMGVAKNKEGAVYFIKNVVPGDIVDIRAYKKRRGYFEAEPITWVKKSDQRITPVCEHFGVCGGCKWQHLNYKGQLYYKEKGVLHNLSHIGKLNINKILPIVGVENPFFYRNKMEFSFSNKRWLTEDEIEEDNLVERRGLGFHKPGMWDKVVDVNQCYLQANPSNEIRNAIRSYALEKELEFFDPREQTGFLRTLMIRNTLGGEVMVLIQFFKDDATAFNKKKHDIIENKGVLNNLISEYIFVYLSKNNIPNHFIERLNTREQLIKKVEIIPIEVVVRNIAAGTFSKRFGISEGTELPETLIEFNLKTLLQDYC